MADNTPDEPRSEVANFLRGQAAELERETSAIDATEVTHRVVARSIEPRRWTHAPVAAIGRGGRMPKVAAAVVAALLIGSVAGFAAGRGSAPKSNVAARGAAQEDTSTPTPVQASGMNGSYAYAGGPGEMQVTRLFIRTTADSVVVRGYLQKFDQAGVAMPACDPNSWCPPAECNSPNSFLAELSNAEAVAQSGMQLLPMKEAAANRGQVPLGMAEGSPTSAWMIQTDDTVANVRASWPDGFTDEMAPVDGWAIVAHAGGANPSSLDAILKDGSTVALRTDGAYAYPSECSPPPPPPPELPPAGTEQPDDVSAAEQAVHKAYETVFNHDVSKDEKGQYIEDAENLKAAGDQVQKNFPDASNSVTVNVGEIRFLSKTEAALYFELDYTGGALFGKQIGYATLIDGVWKISRDTMCMVYGWGGGQCDPPPDPARSTSAGTAPQPGTYFGPASSEAPTTTAAN